MFERMRAAYRRIGKPTKIRKSAQLEVDALEQRATPTSFALPVAPPELVQIGQLAEYSHEAAVRTDLFGAGAGSEPQEVPWHEWFDNDDAAESNDNAVQAAVDVHTSEAPIANDSPDAEHLP